MRRNLILFWYVWLGYECGENGGECGSTVANTVATQREYASAAVRHPLGFGFFMKWILEELGGGGRGEGAWTVITARAAVARVDVRAEHAADDVAEMWHVVHVWQRTRHLRVNPVVRPARRESVRPVRCERTRGQSRPAVTESDECHEYTSYGRFFNRVPWWVRKTLQRDLHRCFDCG
eukprot:646927-Prorocentrum_minimum.AAC.3